QVLVASADPSATEAAPTPLTTPAPSPEPTFALPSPTPAPEPLPSGLAPDIVAAIAWRRETGLRSDPGWVLRVSEDPTASGSWAYPILPGEEAFIWARQERLQPVVGLVQRHAGEYPDEYGGLYIDNANSRVATLWTTNLALHLAAIRELAGADAPVVVLPARWSEAELRAVQDRFDWRWPGFAAVDADPQGAGVDTVRNVVTIDISSANPDALRLIAERLAADLGVPVEMLEVTSDGTGVALLPYGTVKGVVVLAGGAKPGANSLTVDGRAETIGSCGGGDMGYGVGEDGRFEIPCRVGTYTLEITGPGPGGDGGVVVGRARVVVRADRVSVVRIRLVPGAVVGG
ncbi:MAG TPA: hypothetical protein VES19_14980, partial [Candidatus Limnocylindrales bacterium]|nr:hypothetical protein [Candidatus Limnocylindrales bacterium]